LPILVVRAWPDAELVMIDDSGHTGSPATSAIGVGLDAFEGAAAVPAHDGIAVEVVPDSAHGLLERPATSTLPLVVVATKMVSEQLTKLPLE
jgi:hypothetical protein